MKGIKSAISGSIVWAGGVAVGYQMVWIAYDFTHSQLMDPVLTGLLWPLAIAGTVGIPIVAGIVAGGVVVGLLDPYEPRLLGRVSYTLVGGGGVVGALCATAYVVYQLNQSGALMTQTDAMLALFLAAAPTLYAANQTRRPSDDSDQTEQVGTDLAPEEIYRKRRSNTEPSNPPQRKMEASQPTSTQENSETRQTELSTGLHEIDDEELEFDWTTKTGVEFGDIGGMDELKQLVRRDIIKPLTTHRARAQKLGISAPNVVFHGPPGTGKSYFAQALATEVGYPIAKVSGADLKSKWINESASRVQLLLREAEWVADQVGGSIVFIDEIDAVLPKRDGLESHEEDRKVVNEFLGAIEEANEHNVLLIGATNRIDSLDEAAIRNGRFDRKIQIGTPDHKARQSIISVQLSQRPNNVSSEVVEQIAEHTECKTAADLESIIEDSARRALVKRNDDKISPEDLYQALEERNNRTTQINQQEENYPGIF